MENLATGDGYDELNGIRDKVLGLPQGHALRIEYRDMRRALMNMREDVAVTGTTSGSYDKVIERIKRLVIAAESL